MRVLTLTIFLLTNTIISHGQNLISNPSFEGDTFAIKCNNWYNGCGNELTISCDTTLYCQVGFKEESPIPLYWDAWCIILDAGFPHEGYAETYIIGQSGTKVYQLKFYMKSDTTLQGNNSTGHASIGIGSQSHFTASKTLSDTTSTWKQFSLIDTLTTQATDTITIQLSAGICDYCVNRVYFDFIELTITDTLTSIKYLDPFANTEIKIYPNPSKASITFDIKGKINENYHLAVYSSTGRLIRTLVTNKYNVTIEYEDMASGLYFYQVKRTIDMVVIGQGKFIIE